MFISLIVTHTKNNIIILLQKSIAPAVIKVIFLFKVTITVLKLTLAICF